VLVLFCHDKNPVFGDRFLKIVWEESSILQMWVFLQREREKFVSDFGAQESCVLGFL
jgi:hypothetical protein